MAEIAQVTRHDLEQAIERLNAAGKKLTLCAISRELGLSAHWFTQKHAVQRELRPIADAAIISQGSRPRPTKNFNTPRVSRSKEKPVSKLVRCVGCNRLKPEDSCRVVGLSAQNLPLLMCDFCHSRRLGQ